jgi:uncharacterized protein
MIPMSVSTHRDRLGWLVGGAALGVLAAVVLAPSFGPAASRAATDTTPPEHTITVSGTGKALVKPDVADLSLGISVQRAKAKDSQSAAADIMAQVVAAVKADGVADKDIQTSDYSLSPVYDYSSNKATITGYETDNTVSITVRDLSTVGTVIDDATAAGANNVQGISFRMDDSTGAEAQARTDAMTDAKAKADALASAAGVNITGVQSISDQSAPTPMPIYFNGAPRAAAGDSSTTPIEPGNVEVDVTVTVVYLIP